MINLRTKDIVQLFLFYSLDTHPHSTCCLFIRHRGGFTKLNVSSNDVPMVMCLYPGIHTPGLPLACCADDAEYLANQSPPSNVGSSIDNNAYIMNVTLMGGYIDGCALTSQYNNKDNMLDRNPSACGHLINHDSVRKNVDVLAFAWDEVITERRDNDVIMSHKDDESYYPIPNELRADASPWYYDTSLDKIISFPSREQTPLSHSLLYGAAIVLIAPISQGEELLLDYGLKKPYPVWAKDWYQ